MKNLYLLTIAIFTLAVSACGGDDEPTQWDTEEDSTWSDPSDAVDMTQYDAYMQDVAIDPEVGVIADVDTDMEPHDPDFGPDAPVVEDTGTDVYVSESKLTVSLHPDSPAGAGIPGFGEVLRCTVSADANGYVTVDKVMFSVAVGDSTSSGIKPWSACGEDGFNELSKWELSMNGIVIDDAEWTFYDHLGRPCTDGRYVYFIEVDFSNRADGSLVIDAGTMETLSLRADTTGADPAKDDSIRVSIPSEQAVDGTPNFTPSIHHAITWGDAGRNGLDGTDVGNLPVRGGTIIY